MRRNRATTISMPSTGRVDASAESRSKFGDRLKVDRAVQVDRLVDAGAVLVDMTPGFLITFDKGSGQTVWELPGRTYVTDGIRSVRPDQRRQSCPYPTVQGLTLSLRVFARAISATLPGKPAPSTVSNSSAYKGLLKW